MGLIATLGLARPAIAGAVVLACACLPPELTAEEAEHHLRQAAQHFADLEDEKAKAILEELVSSGVTDAKVLLGYLYADPLFEGRDYEEAVVAFEEAAAGGSHEALFQLAESRFWPAYSDWTLTADEEAIRPTLEEVLVLLRQVEEKRHYATRWRLAHLCIFGGYDCDEETTKEVLAGITKNLVLGNLRMITGAFRILDLQHSAKPEAPVDQETVLSIIALGLAAADPFVATTFSEAAWLGLESAGHCPDPRSIDAASWLLALEADAVTVPDGWAEFEHCFDSEQAAAVRQYLVLALDKLAREFGNENTWHLETCYQAPEASTFGDCLVYAVRHHYFACSKLSMIDYFHRRLKVYYASSKRYARCREHMLTAQKR
ncbi:hypothetical protein [Pelagibius sp.]|uniref:hypothetical protein n=1 Tax=Pelagibius sp. TaxID=1931238 RepID=UPI00262D0A03|nr:hypothetical protein [Pelagibius sp.]